MRGVDEAAEQTAQQTAGPGVAGRTLLVVGHPGHELRLFGWLGRLRPQILVLTDGSGRQGKDRLESSRRFIAAAGGIPGQLFGVCSDQQLYRALLQHDFAFFRDLRARIAALLRDGEFRYVIADPVEGYNPTHDLCRMLVNAALVTTQCEGRRCQSYDYPLVGALPELNDSAAPAAQCHVLDDAAMARKIELARAYPELAAEVEQAVREEGIEVLRREWLRGVPAGQRAVAPPEDPPFYETWAERQHAAGIYADVIRYQQHVRPVVECLFADL